MNEPDTARILRRDARRSTDKGRSPEGCGHPEEPNEPITRFTSPCFGKTFALVTVEPVMVLTMFSVALHIPLSAQYLWDRISEDVGYNGSKTSGCSNGSSDSDPLQEEVETLTAMWTLYINIGGFSVGLLVVPLLGSWSDQAGRRPVLILSNLGLALQALVYLMVMYLKLPVAYFLVGRVLCGLSGDYNVVLAACFSYAADVSDRKSRTFRVAVLEACIGISGMVASIIGGKWKQAQGYIEPFWLVLATSLAAALYVYMLVPETVLPDPNAKLFTFRHYKSFWHLISTGGSMRKEGWKSHRTKLWLYLLCFFITITIHIGSAELYVLYELGSPLCWGSTLIGYGSAVLHLAYLTSLLALKIMERCMEESWMALIGLVSNITGLLIISVADTTQLMFTGYVLLLLFMTSAPVLRSKMSKLADQSQQGALFAAVGCVKAMCFLVASALFNSLFSATLHFMKGFTFLFAAILLLIPSGIIGFLEYLEHRGVHKGSTSP